MAFVISFSSKSFYFMIVGSGFTVTLVAYKFILCTSADGESIANIDPPNEYPTEVCNRLRPMEGCGIGAPHINLEYNTSSPTTISIGPLTILFSTSYCKSFSKLGQMSDRFPIGFVVDTSASSTYNFSCMSCFPFGFNKI